MAKRRAASKRRANKVMSFHQAARRKRSEPKADQLQKAVYSQEALEPANLKDPIQDLRAQRDRARGRLELEHEN